MVHDPCVNQSNESCPSSSFVNPVNRLKDESVIKIRLVVV